MLLHKTIIKCLIEIESKSYYSRDIYDLLICEINTLNYIINENKLYIVNLLENYVFNRVGNSVIKEIVEMLAVDDDFAKEYVNFYRRRLSGDAYEDIL